MRKRFKSIATAIMAVLMLINISIPAMAAEQVPMVNDTIELFQEIETTAVANEFKQSNTYLTADKRLGFMEVTGERYSIQHKLKGKLLSGTIGQWVNFRIRHVESGESRSFTAVANGDWSHVTYLAPLQPGTYEIWVINTGRNGNYDFEMKALP